MKVILRQASQWTNLQSLTLRGCPADNRIIDSVNRLKNLQYLELTSNTGLDENALSRQPFLHRLKGLYIATNRAEKTIRKLAGSSNLEILFLIDTGVSPEALQRLARCPRLEFMSIFESREKRLDNSIIDTVVRMKSLRTVGFCRVSAVQVRRLSHCPWIKAVWLYAPAYSPAQKELIKSLDVRVKFEQ